MAFTVTPLQHRVSSTNGRFGANVLSKLPSEAQVSIWTIFDAGPAKALIPARGVPRRHALKVTALATGATDKAVSLFYESLLHATTSTVWVERCRTQVGTVLDVLEADRAARGSTWWFGDRIGHADIAVACLHRFMREVHPEVLTSASRPVLAAHAHLCEALEPFKEISQPFIPPKG